MTKTIFITGTSSGLGKLTAFHFAKRGWNVAATMRTPEKESELTAYDNIKIFKLDVTDIQQVQVATEQAIAAFGKDRRSGQQCWRWLLRTSDLPRHNRRPRRRNTLPRTGVAHVR